MKNIPEKPTVVPFPHDTKKHSSQPFEIRSGRGRIKKRNIFLRFWAWLFAPAGKKLGEELSVSAMVKALHEQQRFREDRVFAYFPLYSNFDYMHGIRCRVLKHQRWREASHSPLGEYYPSIPAGIRCVYADKTGALHEQWFALADLEALMLERHPEWKGNDDEG